MANLSNTARAVKNNFTPPQKSYYAGLDDPALEPDREQLSTFVRSVFKNVTGKDFASLRSFENAKTGKPPVSIKALATSDLEAVIDVACREARAAANHPDGVVFCPPIATFKTKFTAREIDLVEGPVLSVELDDNAVASRGILEGLIGPATIVVESGGVDKNGGPRLHLHWRLKTPAHGEELKLLKEARTFAALLVGGDPTSNSIVHPIRWPGSWHTKGEPALCRTIAHTENEVDLQEAVELLRNVKAPKNFYSEYKVADYFKKPIDVDLRLSECERHGKGGRSLHSTMLECSASMLSHGASDDEVVAKIHPRIMEAGATGSPAAEERKLRKMCLDCRAKFPTVVIDLLKPVMMTSGDFVAGYVPPDYLIDGLLQRRFIYSMTGPTSSGKTAIALLITYLVARGISLGGMEVEAGRVLFFAGENPDDVRQRWIALCEAMDVKPADVDAIFAPGSRQLAVPAIRAIIDREAAEHGPFSLVIVDTSASFNSADDENDRVQMLAHAKMLRALAEQLPGGPALVVNCHPIKTPDMANLVPAGGGAFLNEMDGNLAVIMDHSTKVAKITTHGKWRGPEFSPFSFKMVTAESLKLIDSKGRRIKTVVAEAISDTALDELAKHAVDQQDELLVRMLNHPGLSTQGYADLLTADVGALVNRHKVGREMRALQKLKLATQERGEQSPYILTPKGVQAAQKARAGKV